MNASSSRLMMSNEWSVPRWSCHISIGATGIAVRVDRHDRRVLAAHRHRDDLGRGVGMRGRHLPHRVDELVPHRGRVLLGGVGPAVDRQRPLRGADHGRVVARPARPSGWWSRRRSRARTAWGAFSRADSGRGNVGRRHAARGDRSRSVPRRDHRPLVGARAERRLRRELPHPRVDARVAGSRSGRAQRPLRRARRSPGPRPSRSRCCARAGRTRRCKRDCSRASSSRSRSATFGRRRDGGASSST